MFSEFYHSIGFLYLQEIIPWQMQVLWHPQYGTKVKHNSRLPKEAQLE